jgi:hypothetical protein
MSVFVATFQQVNSDKFKTDKNGEMPFIGNVRAGVAKATLMNGSVFKQSNYIPNKLYLCQNTKVTLEDGRTVLNTEIIEVVSGLELPEYVKAYGQPKLELSVAEANEIIQTEEVGAEA